MISVTSSFENDLSALISGSLPDIYSPSNSFLNFAIAAERVCSASKRLEKSRHVADYFETLNDDDLVYAARYLAGQIFPVHDRRNLSVGHSTIMTAVSRLLGINVQELKTRKMIAGDLGTAAHDLFEQCERRSNNPSSLTLLDVGNALLQISLTSGTKHKTERLKDILRHATPLEVKYLVKMIMGDLRIGLQESTVEDAIARWTGTDVAHVQRANLLVGDIGATAVLAKSRRLDTARLTLFRPIRFMRATAADLVEASTRLPDLFYVEDKFDGVRVQVHLGLDLPEIKGASGCVHEGIRVALFSGTMEDVTKDYPDLVPALSNLLPDCAGAVAANGLILDGEIIRLREGKILPFASPAKLAANPTDEEHADDHGHRAFVAYDILYRNDRVLIQDPLLTRAAALDDLVYDSKRTWRVATRRLTDSRALTHELDAAILRGNEGIVIKDPHASYRPGRRSAGWLKVKHALSTLNVVVTVAETGTGKMVKCLSKYTLAVRASRDDSRLLEIGKTNSGLDDSELVRLTEWFRANTIQQYAQGKVRRVIPGVVLEVAFAKVKLTRRYESGYVIELPRIIRILEDKPLSEIDTLETVRRLAHCGEGD